MNIETKLRKIGLKEGLDDVHLEAYIIFFKNEFPNHMNGDYPYVWARRFKNLTNFQQADNERGWALIKAYKEGLKIFREGLY